MGVRLGTGAAALACATMALGGCSEAPRPIGGAPGIQVAPVTGLPRPEAMDRIAATERLLIGAYDKIEIDVYGVEQLQRSITVDAAGSFMFPLAGQVQAAGRDPEEIAADLTGKLRPYIKDPRVTVNVVERVSQSITVDGQVNRPGQYTVSGRQTLMRAVAAAGGAGEYAHLEDVVIFRTVSGQRYVALYNLGAIRRGAYEDPEVFANDIVIVGDSKARRLFQDFLQATPVLATPLTLLIR